MQIILSIVNGFIESLWRRWFGGWLENDHFKTIFPNWLYKIMASRGTQTFFNVLFLMILFTINNGWVETPFSQWLVNHHIPTFVIVLIMSVIFQLEFWSRGHGPAFDEGRGEVSENSVKRYQKVWWSFIPNHLIPSEHWYGFMYDFIWMMVRYMVGLFLLIPFLWSFKILWLGLITTSIYALTWTISERDEWILGKFPWKMVNRPTDLAELLIGFIVGIWLTIM